jgi:putative heme-binding domain-containing protein
LARIIGQAFHHRFQSFNLLRKPILPAQRFGNQQQRGHFRLSARGELKGTPGGLQGAVIFRRPTVNCIGCHQIGTEGSDFGPALTEIGTKLGKDALFDSILDPSAGIGFGYEAWQFELKNGDEAFGLIGSETEDQVVLKVPGGTPQRLKKSEIRQRTQQKLSIMPANLQAALSAQEFVDLIAYLASLKKP